MAGQPAARLGDGLSHGGTIVQASPNVTVSGKLVARQGDQCVCARHGPVTIVNASGKVKVNGRAHARHGDLTSCGATLIASGKVVVG